MKNLKKLAGIVLALAMLLSLMVPAYATNPAAVEIGSITINGVSESNNTYSIYKLLDLESYNPENGNYAYKVNAAWAEMFKTEEAKKYFAVDEQGYATWIGAEDDATVAAFAKSALAYAKAKGISPVKTSANDGEFVVTEGTGVFSDLELGYYLIDSTVGALCGLTTTNPDASINAKNGIPTIDKQVQEDSTGKFGDSNTADVGQLVYYMTTINVHAGAQNYVLHDKFSDGLTFIEVSGIEHVVPGKDTHDVEETMYEVKTAELTDDCTFEVVFSKELCDELETNDKLIVYYTAMVNRNAIVAADGNPNETWLDFGEGNHTTPDKTQTYTYGIDIVKTDSQNKLIDGAEFRIYDGEGEDANEVKVVLMDDGVTYRRARSYSVEEEGDLANEEGVSIVVNNGKVRVVGLDNGTYYLEETVAPAGYNKLATRQKFIIADANLDAIFNGEVFSTGSGVHVVNKSGTMLPETGGIGTTLFYVLGGVLVAGAVVLMVTRKRMSEK